MVRSICLAVIIGFVIGVGCEKKRLASTPPVAEVQTESPDAKPPDVKPPNDDVPTSPNKTLDPQPTQAETPHDKREAENGDHPTTADQQIESSADDFTAENQGDLDQLLATSPVDLTEQDPLVDMSAWPDAYRLFLPTTAGPLIVDAEIRLGDESLSEVFERRIQDVMQEANEDADTDLSWEDLFSLVTGDPEQFGNQAGFNRGQDRELIQRFDRNRNQRPDRDEVARFLFRNSGIDAAFRLIGTDDYREINRAGSALFAAIDCNGDRALDETEVDAAPESLLRFDPNADQRIDAGEAIVQQDNDPAWDRRRTNRRGAVAMDLDGYVDWTMVSYSIAAMQTRTPFSLAANPVDRIDRDGDKSITAREAKGLLDGCPDLRLRITFATASDQPLIEVVWQRSELDSLTVIKPSAAEVAVSDQSLTLLVSAVDRQLSRDRVPREAFDTLDANNDGVLEESEIPAAVPEAYAFENLDADGDGKLTYQEVNSGPQTARPPIWAAQVRARAAEYPDGLFAWLDQNHDRFLSTREILIADKRLRQCNRDGQDLKPTDIPDTFAIQFMRADPMQDQRNFSWLTSVASTSSDWPRWAQTMDVNRDGEISGLEFPGSAQQFQKLDTSGDGFIDTSEIAVAD